MFDTLAHRWLSYWQWPARLICLAYAAALFTLTHMPIPPQAAAAAASWDKVFHCGAYGVLALLTAWAALCPRRLEFPLMPVLLGLMLFAGLDEVLQGPVGRTPDVADWLADTLGILCGLLTAWGLTGALAWGMQQEPVTGAPLRVGKTKTIEP